MDKPFFEDYREGQVVQSPGRTITETDIVNFASFTGDWAQMHTNREFAQKAFFKERVAHGALTFAVSTGLAVRSGIMHDETTIGFYGVDTLRYLKPVLIGDTIKVNIRVTGKQDKGQKGVVDLEIRVVNQREEDVAVYTMKILSKKKN